MADLPPLPIGLREGLDQPSRDWLDQARRAIGDADIVYLDSAQNLNDLPNKTTARTNLDVQQADGALQAVVDAAITEVADEDNMASDSATKLSTQQAIKAYVDTQTAGLQEPAMVFIESQDASASASLAFTGFNASSYDSYVFKIANLLPATDGGDLQVHTSTDGGSTYDNTAGDYSWGFTYKYHGGAFTSNNNASSASLVMAENIGNAGSEYGYSGTVDLLNPDKAVYVCLVHSGHYQHWTVGDGVFNDGSGMRLSAGDVDAIRFRFSTGNITSGRITMYGMRSTT